MSATEADAYLLIHGLNGTSGLAPNKYNEPSSRPTAQEDVNEQATSDPTNGHAAAIRGRAEPEELCSPPTQNFFPIVPGLASYFVV